MNIKTKQTEIFKWQYICIDELLLWRCIYIIKKTYSQICQIYRPVYVEYIYIKRVYIQGANCKCTASNTTVTTSHKARNTYADYPNWECGPDTREQRVQSCILKEWSRAESSYSRCILRCNSAGCFTRSLKCTLLMEFQIGTGFAYIPCGDLDRVTFQPGYRNIEFMQVVPSIGIGPHYSCVYTLPKFWLLFST